MSLQERFVKELKRMRRRKRNSLIRNFKRFGNVLQMIVIIQVAEKQNKSECDSDKIMYKSKFLN